MRNRKREFGLVIAISILALVPSILKSQSKMNSNAGIMGFTAKDLQEQLFEMLRIRQRILRGQDIELPLISIQLSRDCQEVSGFLIDIKEEKDAYNIVLQRSGSTTTDLFYTSLIFIQGVTIHDIDKYERILADVRSETQMNRIPTVTKLDVKTKAQKEQARLLKQTGINASYKVDGTLPEGNVPLFVVSNLITDVTTCLIELGDTEVGKQAIGSLSKITFVKNDSQFSLTKKDSELIVQGKFNQSFTTSDKRWKLKDQLETLF